MFHALWKMGLTYAFLKQLPLENMGLKSQSWGFTSRSTGMVLLGQVFRIEVSNPKNWESNPTQR